MALTVLDCNIERGSQALDEVPNILDVGHSDDAAAFCAVNRKHLKVAVDWRDFRRLKPRMVTLRTLRFCHSFSGSSDRGPLRSSL